MSEIFSSYQGEGASVPGSCQGRRQIFLRFSGCPLKCNYCDTVGSKQPTKTCRIEQKPGSGEYLEINNPLQIVQVETAVEALKTQDLHSISFTGGEPLAQPEFCRDLALALKEKNYLLFLETNAYFLDQAEEVCDLFDYVSADVKDKSAEAHEDWEKLLNREIDFIRVFSSKNKTVYAKLTVSKKTQKKDVETVAEKLSALPVPLVIQIVTPVRGVQAPSFDQVCGFCESAAFFLGSENVCIGTQTHKLLRIP